MEYALVGTQTPRTLSLRGAHMRWRSEAGRNDVYVPGVRIVGSERAVRAWLHENGHPETLMHQAFRNGDQTTQRFKEAVKQATPPQKTPTPKDKETSAFSSKTTEPAKSPLKLVRHFNARIDLSQPIKLRNHRNEEKTSPCKSSLLKRVPQGEEDTTDDTVLGAPPSSHKHIMALQKKMSALPEHKVLDVTSYDPSTGKGARILQKPSPRDLTRRGIPGVPLVSRTGEPLRTLLNLLGIPERAVEVNW